MKEPEGKFYTIGEISTLTEVPAHILRYWEKEFSFLRPLRDHRGHRLYTTRDVAKINQIKELVYQEGYRLRGVKRRLRQQYPKKQVQSIVGFLRQILKELKEMEKCSS